MRNIHNGYSAKSIQLEDEACGEPRHLKNGSEFTLLTFNFEDDLPQTGTKKPLKYFQMDGAYELALFYPADLPRHVLTQAGSNNVYAYLVRHELIDPERHFTDLGLPETIIPRPIFNLDQAASFPSWFRAPDWQRDFTAVDLPAKISSFESPTNLDIPGSEPLTGQIEVRHGAFLHKNTLFAKMDLTDDNGLVLEAKFKSCNAIKFEPIWILLFIGYMIHGV